MSDERVIQVKLPGSDQWKFDFQSDQRPEPGVYTLPEVDGKRKVIIIENPNKKEE